MTSLTRFYQAERQAQRTASNVVQLQQDPSLEYRLTTVVFVADWGYGASPRYAVETFDPDRGVGSLEYEGDDGVEALRVAIAESESRHSIRVEFVGPLDLKTE